MWNAITLYHTLEMIWEKCDLVIESTYLIASKEELCLSSVT